MMVGDFFAKGPIHFPTNEVTLQVGLFHSPT